MAKPLSQRDDNYLILVARDTRRRRLVRQRVVQIIIERHYGLIILGINKALPLHLRSRAEEYVSYGVEAMVAAVRCFDTGRNIKWSTYATNAVQRQVYRAYREDSGVIHVPHKHAASGKEQAAAARKCAMFSMLEAGDTNRSKMLGGVAAPCDHGAAEDIERLRNAITALPSRLRTIVTGRMAGLTLEDIGHEIGVSKERVRQEESKALDELRLAMGVPVLRVRHHRAGRPAEPGSTRSRRVRARATA